MAVTLSEIAKLFEGYKKEFELMLIQQEKVFVDIIRGNLKLFNSKLEKAEKDIEGPIGLSLMVVMAEAFLQNIERKALNIATICTCEPKAFVRYVDDCHARFNSIKQQQMFLNILSEQNPAIKYTVELENHQKQLNFLDVNITNTMHGAYEFEIHRKEATTNIQLKPNSNINPNIITGVFKGFLCRAKRLCSQKYLKKEIDFLIEMFVENGYNKNNLINIARNFLKNELKNINYKPTDNQPFIKLPWIPIVGLKLRKELRKQNIKTKLPPNTNPGVYQLKCSCNSIYIGETKKKVISRCIENKKNSVKGKWASSGATEHSKSCQGTIDWFHPKTISIAPEYHIRKIRESLEVNRAKVRQKLGSDEKVLNRDDKGKESQNFFMYEMSIAFHADVMDDFKSASELYCLPPSNTICDSRPEHSQ
nr:uncharacterized protein LOC124811196 [Hydra vulgaris]